MNELDVNILIQTLNEKLSTVITELIVKEATIKQLNSEINNLLQKIKEPKNIKNK